MNTWRTASFQPQKLLASWRRRGLDWSNHLELGPFRVWASLAYAEGQYSSLSFCCVVTSFPPWHRHPGLFSVLCSYSFPLSSCGGSGRSAQIRVCSSKCVLNARHPWDTNSSFFSRDSFCTLPAEIKCPNVKLTQLPVWYIYLFITHFIFKT